MDAHLQFLSQLVQRFTVLPLAARVTAGGLLLLVLLGIGLLGRGSSPVAEDFLLGGEAIPPGQLPAVESAFAKAGLNDYALLDGRIRVPRDDKHRYVAALADAKVLPPSISEILDDAVRTGSPLETSQQKLERIKNARQRVLSQIVGSLRGIEHAMVLYDAEKKPGLAGGQKLTASVSVQPADEGAITIEQVRTIRNLVSAAIAGLLPEQVSVTDLNTGGNFPPGPLETGAAASDSYARRKRDFEQASAEKLAEGLAWIPGLMVHVGVELVQSEAGSGTEGVWLPGHVHVTLSVPNRYVQKVWRRRHGYADQVPSAPVPAGELAALKTKLQSDLKMHVDRLMSRPARRPAADPQILVTYFDDVRSAPLAVSDAAGSDGGLPAAPWGLMAISLLAVVGLLVARWMQRPGATAAQTTTEVPTQTPDTSIHTGLDLTTMPTTPPAEPQPPPALRDAARAVEGPVPKPPPVTVHRGSSRLVPARHTEGIELNDLTTALLETRHPSALPSSAGRRVDSAFGFAERVGADELVELLSSENPQVVAIVFSHLAAPLAAEVLKRFPTSMQTDILRRLADMDDMSEEVIREIEIGLESRLASQLRRTQRRHAGLKAINSILTAAGSDTRQGVLSHLQHHDTDLLDQLQPQPAGGAGGRPMSNTPQPGIPIQQRPPSTFDDVLQLDDRALRCVLDRAEPRMAVLALSGAPADVADRLMKKMNPGDARRLRRALADLGPADPRDIDSGQQHVLKTAREIHSPTHSQPTSIPTAAAV